MNSTLKVAPSGDREIVVTRVFDAPRKLVFDALTRPELIKRWLGPRGWSLTECRIDLRVGGALRFVGGRPGGAEMGWGGVFLEVSPPERFVNTEVFDEPWYPGEAVVTTVLSERGGKTTLTLTLRYETRDARDGVLKTQMQHGIAESYDKLAELLASTSGAQRGAA
jgi:uncharacterized protein YndB with AHSA1/START domain